MQILFLKMAVLKERLQAPDGVICAKAHIAKLRFNTELIKVLTSPRSGVSDKLSVYHLLSVMKSSAFIGPSVL